MIEILWVLFSQSHQSAQVAVFVYANILFVHAVDKMLISRYILHSITSSVGKIIFLLSQSSVITNRKIQNEANEGIKQASQLYHLVKGLLRKKDIKEKCKFDIFKNLFQENITL